MERWQMERLERAREALTGFIERAAVEQQKLEGQIQEAKLALNAINTTTRRRP